MTTEADIRAVRLEKLNRLKASGMNPYPATSARTHSIAEAQANFDDLAKSGQSLTLAGRIMSLRSQGALTFLTLNDGEIFQALLKTDTLSVDQWQLFVDTVDIGDLVDLTGTAFTTKRGEPTLLVTKWQMLAKTLRPLPEKWHGLKDPETRLRQRYLDILFNPEVKDLVVKRAKFWQAIREFLTERGFLEVETPILEVTPGGADARPFITHHNDLGLDLYLRISAGELWQKQLLIGGFDKVFELGRVFRNEGTSHEHLQDYTHMEFYLAYADWQQGMSLTKDLYQYVAQATFGTLKFNIHGWKIDLSGDWPKQDYGQIIKDMTGLDITVASLTDITNKLNDLQVEYKTAGFNRARALDALWKYCRRQIAGPIFIVGEPKELSPLAKESIDRPGLVERFHPIIAGSELGNGYSELNDPLEQADRLAAQAKLRQAGDQEAQMYNQDFITALEFGLPPACGFGLSERVFSFLAGVPIREGQIFPLLKPKS